MLLSLRPSPTAAITMSETDLGDDTPAPTSPAEGTARSETSVEQNTNTGDDDG